MSDCTHEHRGTIAPLWSSDGRTIITARDSKGRDLPEKPLEFCESCGVLLVNAFVIKTANRPVQKFTEQPDAANNALRAFPYWLNGGQFYCDVHRCGIPFWSAPADAVCAECSNDAPESYLTRKEANTDAATA